MTARLGCSASRHSGARDMAHVLFAMLGAAMLGAVGVPPLVVACLFALVMLGGASGR